MAKQALNQIKQFFLTGKFPTQQQFFDAFESFWHKDEKLPIDSISGLKEQLQNINNYINNGGGGGGSLPPIVITGVDNHEIPAGTFVDMIHVYDDADTVISIGTTPDGTDKLDSAACSPPYHVIQNFGRNFPDAETIYISGMTSNTLLKLYRR